jgi:hypothetical protein
MPDSSPPVLDLRELAQPCLTWFAPRTCRSSATDPAAPVRSPIDHVCWQSRSTPHVCRCARCGSNGLPRYWGRGYAGLPS